jgi:hypothetical protein
LEVVQNASLSEKIKYLVQIKTPSLKAKQVVEE